MRVLNDFWYGLKVHYSTCWCLLTIVRDDNSQKKMMMIWGLPILSAFAAESIHLVIKCSFTITSIKDTMLATEEKRLMRPTLVTIASLDGWLSWPTNFDSDWPLGRRGWAPHLLATSADRGSRTRWKKLQEVDSTSEIGNSHTTPFVEGILQKMKLHMTLHEFWGVLDLEEPLDVWTLKTDGLFYWYHSEATVLNSFWRGTRMACKECLGFNTEI